MHIIRLDKTHFITYYIKHMGIENNAVGDSSALLPDELRDALASSDFSAHGETIDGLTALERCPAIGQVLLSVLKVTGDLDQTLSVMNEMSATAVTPLDEAKKNFTINLK